MLIFRRHVVPLLAVMAAHGALFAALAVGKPPPPITLAAIPVSLFDGQGMVIPARIRPEAEPQPPSPALEAPPVDSALAEPPNPQPTEQQASPDTTTTESVMELATRLVRDGPSPIQAPLDVGSPPAPAPPPPAAPPAAGQTCEIAGALQARLQTDPVAMAALAKVPRASRSIANAILLWDGEWGDPSLLADLRTADAIRGAIVRAVNAQPAVCRDELVRGPRFIPIVNGGDTTMLAVGSGEWRWTDLLPAASPGP